MEVNQRECHKASQDQRGRRRFPALIFTVWRVWVVWTLRRVKDLFDDLIKSYNDLPRKIPQGCVDSLHVIKPIHCQQAKDGTEGESSSDWTCCRNKSGLKGWGKGQGHPEVPVFSNHLMWLKSWCLFERKGSERELEGDLETHLHTVLSQLLYFLYVCLVSWESNSISIFLVIWKFILKQNPGTNIGVQTARNVPSLLWQFSCFSASSWVDLPSIWQPHFLTHIRWGKRSKIRGSQRCWKSMSRAGRAPPPSTAMPSFGYHKIENFSRFLSDWWIHPVVVTNAPENLIKLHTPS